jgi:NTP pyrophosphatase (non-canonical NTP hydrolase)
MKTLNELRDKIHENAVKHGFYDDEASAKQVVTAGGAESTVKALKHAFFAQKIALIHSELSEALEADREDKYPTKEGMSIIVNPVKIEEWKLFFERHIKNTVPDEFADVIIRILDKCGDLNIDIEKHIELKMKYNELREHKHGKNY